MESYGQNSNRSFFCLKNVLLRRLLVRMQLRIFRVTIQSLMQRMSFENLSSKALCLLFTRQLFLSHVIFREHNTNNFQGDGSNAGKEIFENTLIIIKLSRSGETYCCNITMISNIPIHSQSVTLAVLVQCLFRAWLFVAHTF